MRVRLTSSIVIAVLFVVPVFGQEPEEQPTYRGQVFGEAGRIRADFGAFLALQAVPVGSGLEVDNYQDIKLLVADVPDDLQEIGLTQDSIRGRVEQRLQSLNFTPLPENDASPQWLSVAINGVGSAYDIDVSFFRNTYYLRVDDRDVFTPTDPDFTLLTNMAVTWTTGSVGTHGGDPNFVLNSVERHLDEFLNEYLASNQP